MAFPSGKDQLTLRQAFDLSRDKARIIKQSSIAMRDQALAGTLSRKQVMDFSTTLADAIDDFVSASALPGIIQYARDQIDDQEINLGTEFTAMVNTAIGVRDWIIANFPNNGGFLLERSFDTNGRMVLGIFTAAQTAGLRTELDLLIAAIDD